MTGAWRAMVWWVAMIASVALVGSPALAGDARLARQLTDRGIELQQRGDHNAALRLFDAALIEVNHPKIRYFRAKSLKSLKRHDEAIAEFESILDRPEVAKYQTEISAFINDMKGKLERERLNKQLEQEQQARAKAEAERNALERKNDLIAIDLMRSKRSGLMPTRQARALDGPLVARVVPMVPTSWDSSDNHAGRESIAAIGRSFDRYDTQLTAAKVLTVVSALSLSTGVGVGLNPLADHAPGPTAQQTGLAIGVVGVVAGLAAIVVWPSEPPDPRITPSPLGASR